MAYISQEEKSKIAPVVKDICKKYGVKATLSINNHSTLVLTISSAKIDFIQNYNQVGEKRNHDGRRQIAKDYLQVNTYWYHEHFDGKAKEFLEKVISAMKGQGWFDKSDIQTDYFHVKHYVDVNVGRWNKPFVVSA